MAQRANGSVRRAAEPFRQAAHEHAPANGRGVYAEALKRGLGLLPSKFAASDLRGRAARPVHAFQRVEDTRDPGGRLLRH
eukprot:2296824-Prymnesium_polylepis.3